MVPSSLYDSLYKCSGVTKNPNKNSHLKIHEKKAVCINGGLKQALNMVNNVGAGRAG